jgi:hypothetical protein
LQNPSQINGDDLQNLRRGTSYLGTRNENIWKAKLMSLKLIIKTKILEILQRYK